MSEQVHTLAYFPYLGLFDGEEFVLGAVSVWSSSLLDEKVTDPTVRERIRELLNSHRAPVTRKGKSRPLDGIGIVSSGSDRYIAADIGHVGSIEELRYTLFLSCLGNNVTLAGPNAGHYLYTAENFSLVFQNFRLESEYISEVTGVLVTLNRMGLRIGDVEFPTPTYVPNPRPFRQDGYLWRAMIRIRQMDRLFFRRIMAATSLFIESYHNSHQVDMRARVLLQMSAFEVLLNLPERHQRLAFKAEIERLCKQPDERRYRYKYEVRGQKRPETRTQKGIWADRFYMLRNRIIHGENVSSSDYLYRGSQHHVMIAPMFFVVALKRLLQERGTADGEDLQLYTRLDWERARPAEDEFDEDEVEGFRVRRDMERYILAQL